MSDSLRRRLAALPKAELHLHLEGSLHPELVWELAQRHGFPHGLRSLDACRRLYECSDFTGFITAIKTASQLLVAPADYGDAVERLAEALAGQGVVYAEIFVSIGILLWRQAPVEPFWEALEAARLRAQRRHGVRIAWLFDAVRQLGAGHAEAVLDWALRLRGSGPVAGIGIGGDERLGPAAWFVPTFARAREQGLRLTAHAGETTGAEAVRQAVALLGAERIGHGLGAVDDAALCEQLRRGGVALDLCPTSNFRTGCWPPHQAHPARAFFDRGLTIAIGSDDPGIFATDLLAELVWLHEHAGFAEAELQRLLANSFQASFLPPEDKRHWLRQLETACAAAAS